MFNVIYILRKQSPNSENGLGICMEFERYQRFKLERSPDIQLYTKPCCFSCWSWTLWYAWYAQYTNYQLKLCRARASHVSDVVWNAVVLYISWWDLNDCQAISFTTFMIVFIVYVLVEEWKQMVSIKMIGIK